MKILFLCVANSVRSQMAEAIAREMFGQEAVVASASPTPATAHPLAVEVMAEIGMDIGEQRQHDVTPSDMADYDVVVTLCAEEVHPALPPRVKHLRWPVPDPELARPEEALTVFRQVRDQLRERIRVLHALRSIDKGPDGIEFHASVRVSDLARAVEFYAWLLDGWPKEWTHRYATFIRPDLKTNFVVVVADGKQLHHDTLYHLGIAVEDKHRVIAAYEAASERGFHVEKPPRTTWRGTPLHELWLKDPDGNLIEVYARLTEEELVAKPDNLEPDVLVPWPPHAS